MSRFKVMIDRVLAKSRPVLRSPGTKREIRRTASIIFPEPGVIVESKPADPAIARKQVAEAAYFLWLQRGGNETENWLDAEAVLRLMHN